MPGAKAARRQNDASHAGALVPRPSAGGSVPMNASGTSFVDVDLGPFTTAKEACEYCYGSFTKAGTPENGAVAPACVCMAYEKNTEFVMFCATPVSAAGYIASMPKGCRCQARDMEHMAATTCAPISAR